MKIVVNSCYGGFHVPQGFLALHPDADEWDIPRTDPDLIEYCESHPDELKFHCTDLRVIEFPDTATDWYVNEYDGAEDLIYVLDGKLEWA